MVGQVAQVSRLLSLLVLWMNCERTLHVSSVGCGSQAANSSMDTSMWRSEQTTLDVPWTNEKAPCMYRPRGMAVECQILQTTLFVDECE